MEMRTILLSDLEGDPRNANVCLPETLAKIQNNIQKTRLCPPLIVRPHPEIPNRFVIVDGHHRKQILVKLGWQDAPCQIWPISEKEATLALATLNRLRGEDQPRKRAELLNALMQSFTKEDLEGLLPESQSEMADLLALLQFDTEQAEKRMQALFEEETKTLPVPFTFLVPAEQAHWVEEGLKLAEDYLTPKDRAESLVWVCQQVLEQKVRVAHEQ